MSDKGNQQHDPANSLLLLGETLSTIRRLVESPSCQSPAELVAISVQALRHHPSFDACMVTLQQDSPDDLTQHRETSGMPPELVGLLDTDVLPPLLQFARGCAIANLSDRCRPCQGSLLAVPVCDGDMQLGGIVVWSADPDAWMPWHTNLLEMVAAILALRMARIGTELARAQQRDVEIKREQGMRSSVDWPERAGPPYPGTDALTGLLNRVSFEAGLRGMIGSLTSRAHPKFVLFIDVDRFRMVREFAGDTTAERVVRTLADVLRRSCTGELAIARLSVDEFGLVIERRSDDQALDFAESLVRLVDGLRLSISGRRYDISVSVGVARVDQHEGLGGDPLYQAMQACRSVKLQGGGAAQLFQQQVHGSRSRLQDGRMLNQLTSALKDDQLMLFAQPILSADPSDTQAQMYELLLRMRDQNGNILSAGNLIAVAERYGLSVKLDRWVIQRALSQIASSDAAGNVKHRFTINLSGHSVNDGQLLEFIIKEFQSSKLAPNRVCFEITETAAISDIAAAKHFVSALSELGCQFALDDFGSGHSSFVYLRDLPVSYLKIDGELVRDIAEDPVSLAFVRTINSVAHLMGKQTIAEFVENRAILELLKEIGCDSVQGYWTGGPVPLEEILEQKSR